MTEEDIINLIEQARNGLTETSRIEFKDARGGMPTDIWRSISSFSHSPEGGVIVFGIKEDRAKKEIIVVGGLQLADLQERIVSFCREVMINAEIPDLMVLEYEGKQVLAMVVNPVPDEKKPCYNRKLNLPAGACIRVGNTDRVITFDEMKEFIRNSALYKYDKIPAPGATLNSLSLEKITDFLVKSAARTERKTPAEANPDVIKNIGAATENEGVLVPTIAGYLIFSKTVPQNQAPYSRYIIRAVRYSGITPASPIVDKLDIEGTLDEQIDEMQRFILRNIPVRARIKGTRRVESYEYPPDAIRELVANAVIHRDYMITETYTQISIFSNRIEISNPGNLPPGISVENIKQSQFSRNEVIASILKDMDYLEEYGRGIDIVFALMHEYGLREPIFRNNTNSFKVVLPGAQFSELNERQIRIWRELHERNHMTSKECLQLFSSVSRATISTDLSKLVELGLILPRGSGSASYYEII